MNPNNLNHWIVLAVLWLFKESRRRKRRKAADNAILAQRAGAEVGSHCNLRPDLLEVSSTARDQQMGKKPTRLSGGTKFHLLLTGEGCKGVAVPPATDLQYALGVHHFIYLFSWAFTQTTSHDAANSYIRATALTKFSALESNRRWQGRSEALASCPCSLKPCLAWLYKARGGRRRGTRRRNVAHTNTKI